jgi:hypothetical protein
MKKSVVAGIAALFMIAPAIAWDADPASFRANPQAWVRDTLVPACKTPAGDQAAACTCLVSLLASQITEADVARVNDPDFKRAFVKIALGATMLCLPRK